jgi:hypothetical protein
MSTFSIASTQLDAAQELMLLTETVGRSEGRVV